VVAEELIDRLVVLVPADCMVVVLAEEVILVVAMLVVKVLLFLHTIQRLPRYQVLQQLAQQQLLVLQQQQFHLPHRAVMVVQPLLHTQQRVVLVELLAHYLKQDLVQLLLLD
jgi:hypothetical protein